MSLDSDEFNVELSVTGFEPDEQQERVLQLYAQNAETFLRKNQNYGGSFEHSAKLESILRHGEVREDELFDIIAEQILVRGFYDKLSRFHQLQIQDGDDLVGEDIDDTLLDMANYAIMLTAMRQKYDEQHNGVELPIFEMDEDFEWDAVDVEDFMETHDYR